MKKYLFRFSFLILFVLSLSFPSINGYSQTEISGKNTGCIVCQEDEAAAKRPMFGQRKNCGPCTLGYRWCTTTTYVFWLAFEGDPSPEPC